MSGVAGLQRCVAEFKNATQRHVHLMNSLTKYLSILMSILRNLLTACMLEIYTFIAISPQHLNSRSYTKVYMKVSIMAKQAKRSMIAIDPKVANQWKFIAEKCKYSVTGLLTDIGNELYGLAIQYPENLNFNIMSSQNASMVYLQLLGKNRCLISGKFAVSVNIEEKAEKRLVNEVLRKAERTVKVKSASQDRNIFVEKGEDFDSVAKKMHRERELSKKVN